MKTRIAIALAVLFLPSCAAIDGLALSYTRKVSGLDVTGFVSADGTGGILIKRSGKEPVKAQK